MQRIGYEAMKGFDGVGVVLNLLTCHWNRVSSVPHTICSSTKAVSIIEVSFIRLVREKEIQ